MGYIEGQLLAIFSQILYRHAEIVSGGYKLNKMQKACNNNNEGETLWLDLTEDEKLQESLNIMKTQIRRFNDALDHFERMKKDG